VTCGRQASAPRSAPLSLASLLDSDIAERVFLEMAAKEVCTLGWHDSFVVQKSRSNDLVEVMQNAYRDIVRSEPPLIR
jgi:hypothetical protein